MAVKVKTPSKLLLKDLVPDDTNPNVMSEEQETALAQSMQRFGMVEPILVGREGKKYKVYNGNHRIKHLQEAGNKYCYGYVISGTSADLRLLRQITNKLHGLHDPELDKIDMDLILAQESPEELSLLLAEPISDEQPDKTDKPSFGDERRDSYLNGNLKQIYVVMDNETYLKVMDTLDKIKNATGLDTHTDIFMEILHHYENTKLAAKTA